MGDPHFGECGYLPPSIFCQSPLTPKLKSQSEVEIKLAARVEQAQEEMIERGGGQVAVVGVTVCHRSEPLSHVSTSGLNGH